MITRSTRGSTWLLLLSGVVLQGCAWPLRAPFETSAPQVIPAGIDGKVGPDGRTTLRLDGLDVRIETRNQRPKGVGLVWILPFPAVFPLPASDVFEDPNPLSSRQLLYLDLRAREPGFAFNPMAVLLAADTNSAAPPQAYIGPGRDGEICTDSSGNEFERSTADTSFSIEPSEEEWTCFVLAFRISSSPEVPFRLVLAGLTRSGEDLPPLELSFSKRKGRSWLITPRTWRPEPLIR